MADSKPRCGSCRYFDPTVEVNAVDGLCRIRAPRIAAWPSVRPEDWCGEHQLTDAARPILDWCATCRRTLTRMRDKQGAPRCAVCFAHAWGDRREAGDRLVDPQR